MRYLIALTYCFLAITIFPDEEEELREDLFLSTPEQVATLMSESSYLVGGLISPLSGQPVLRRTDLIIKGAQDITLSRIYLPPYIPCSFPEHKHCQEEYDKKHLYYHLRESYKGWQFYPHLRLEFIPHLMEARLSEPNGMTLDFRLSGPGFSKTSLAYQPYAISNVVGDMPNGKYDPRNTRISYEENGHKIVVYAVDGTTRVYRKKGWITRTSYLYFLEKEILLNGKILKYHYNGRNQLHCVESLDPKERYVYASLRIAGTPLDGHCHFTASSGLTVDYNYKRSSIHWKIKDKIKGGGKHKEECTLICPPILTSVSSPSYRHESLDYCGRFLLSSYFGKDNVFTNFHAGFGEGGQHYRVHKLQLPVGQDDSFQTVYELSYHPPIAGQSAGTTTIKNNDGTSIIYHFSKNLLTSLIQYFGQDGGLKKEKVFSWDDKNWLKTLEVRDSQKNILYRKSFEYDRFGNPILEIFVGDLTGEGNQETFATKRIFSDDGKNLLLREETEDGKAICFSYLPNTDLITSKLTKDDDKIILREFFVYDDCNNLVQTICDDGISKSRDDLSHVTQQTLKTYTLRESAPFLHMPEWIEEAYLENGTKKLLKKSHLLYDQYGNVAQEEVYNAKGNYAYTIYKTYNERGDILSETNCLEQEATYTYNSRGFLETSFNFSHRLHTTFHHDTKGRLKALTKKGDDGIIYETFSEYDFHDRKIQETDPFQNVTYHKYDSLVNKIIKTDFPSITSIDGEETSVSTMSNYDPFGRQLTKTDANENTIIYRYNAYGSHTEIIYPQGGREVFRYTKNGQLNCHTNLDGLTIYYKHDVLGRTLSKTYVSSNDKTLAEEIFTYNGFNLLTETDKEGNLKQYSYDGAGRKTREEFCGHITDFSYDALGRVSKICQHNGNNTLFINYTRDLEGKVLEKLKTDTAEHILYKISYSYDGDGNQETITRYINEKNAVDRFAYDSFCRPIQYQDAEGFITKITYNENFNPLGQKVLQKKTIDPHHTTTLETQDALTRTIKVETLNSQGAHIACHELFHDPQGNLLYRRDHIYKNNHCQSTQTIKYGYTSDHQIESLTRGFGTKDARTTFYTYLSSGKIATKTPPNGITLTYSYHPLGFISHVDSSDDKVHHAFEYDRLGYLRSALDENHHIAIRREVDAFGNITQELFPHNLKISKDYDCFSRPISLKIENQGEICYTYDPLFLRQVTRISKRGAPLYSHTYEEYNLNGNLVSENMIGGLSRIDHLTEARGQKASISSLYFVQDCKYDAVGNLVTNTIDKVKHQYSYDGISQLSSENNPKQSIIYFHDSLYNRIQKNETSYKINNLDELMAEDEIQSLYDLNGNQILKKNEEEITYLTYDPLNRLIEASSKRQKIQFAYDPLGRRLSKTVYTPTTYGWKESDQEYYLYDDQNEIGAFTISQHPKNLRILGLDANKDNPITIGIEVNNQVFAPLVDIQGNIRRLINLKTGSITASYNFTAFGEALNVNPRDDIPWQFASKRLDSELGLIYFGKRYYNPRLGRWLTTDPAGFVDSLNLYQYALNNPFRYYDARGDSLGGYLLGLGEIILGGTIIAGGFALEVVTVGGFTVGLGVTTSTGAALMGLGLATTTYHAQDRKTSNILWKNTDVYAPDRPLPRDPRTKEPVPETDAPHTELGTKNGTKGKYPQAREFDAQGKPVKDIDFTDHGRPQNHSNPHEHKWKSNPTGGTPQRSPEAEPLIK